MGQGQALEKQLQLDEAMDHGRHGNGQLGNELRSRKRNGHGQGALFITAFTWSTRIARKRGILDFKQRALGRRLYSFAVQDTSSFVFAAGRALPGALFFEDKSDFERRPVVLGFHRVHEFDTQMKYKCYYTKYLVQAFTSSCFGHRDLFLLGTEPYPPTYLEN